LITAQDIAIHRAAPGTPATQAPAAAFAERLLLIVLYVTVLASSVAFIEPSPHDALIGVLAIICLIAGVRFERALVVPLLLLLVWNVAGMMSLLNVSAEEKAIQYTGTSIYLAIAALIFACLFARNTMPRLATMRAAYVLTAVMVALAGISGYFSLFPGAHDLFATNDRALGAFKDPNVFGPFMIWPALVVFERMLARRIRLTDVLIAGILLLGLLLSFSRGAWFHFAVSALVLAALTFLTAPSPSARMRVFSLTALCVVTLVALVMFLLSFSAIQQMFQERAHLINSYDVGPGGRFRLQELAVAALLKFPDGMGPFEFARLYGNQQHNVYLQAFLVYGWIGGASYILMVLSTLLVGLHTAWIATPWRPYLITAFAAFVGEVGEGFIVDTDHWRHFFLLLGIIWGLFAATTNYRHQTTSCFGVH